MAGFNGRQMTFDWDSVTIAGVQTRDVGRNNELVDVTSDDDNGWRTYLANPGVKAVEISLSGVTKDEVFVAEFYNASVTGETLTINLPSNLASPGNEEGTFMVQSFEQSGDHDGDIQFSVTLVSSGAVTYTASSA